MSKKKPIEEPENIQIESETETTKPVATSRKAKKADIVFESAPAAEPEDNSSVDKSKTDKPKKVRHGKWVWLGILIMIVIAALGSGISYGLAMNARMDAEKNLRLEKAATQFVMAEQDQMNGDLEMAWKRLNYVLEVFPEYPGLDSKLSEVMLAMSLNNEEIPTIAATEAPVAVTAVPTKDTKVVSVLFTQAKSQMAASDWGGLLSTINQIRNIDPAYEPIQVDGMFYLALRNNGISTIKSGNLETGLYYFAQAEKIAPLDRDTLSWQNWSRMYLIASSWYGVNWQKAADNFYMVYVDVPALIDTSKVTAKQRYVNSLEGLGDTYMMTGTTLSSDYCVAASQYRAASSILNSETLALKIQQADAYCANPPATPTPTVDPYAPTPTPTPDSFNPTE